MREEHASLASNEAALERELELLRHQSAEIQSAALRADEEDELQARYSRAANSRRLIELATGVAGELAESEPAILTRLSETARLLRELEKIDPAAASLVASHNSAVVELEELARSLVSYAEKTGPRSRATRRDGGARPPVPIAQAQVWPDHRAGDRIR